LALSFPIRDWWGEDRENRLLSVVLVLTVVLIPVYIILFAVQNPFIDRDGRPMVVTTLLVAIFFWPALFVLNSVGGRFDNKGPAAVLPQGGTILILFDPLGLHLG
jgi:O-antigen/teichoic acid export membrane protein